MSDLPQIPAIQRATGGQGSEPPTPVGTSGGTKLAYSPPLDGLRAICLIAVLLFHSPFGWMSGGFLGVSTFFTLSGYLIAALLIREHRGRGAIDLAAFWDRRLRRLGPALWLGVVGVVSSAPWWLAADSRERLLPDAAATLAYVSNWRFMAPEYAYSQLFSSPSPLLHSWSLSIEAQYYLVFPVVLALCFRGTATVWRFATVLSSFFVLSLACAIADPSDSNAANRVYYGTLARASEPLAGALLALVLAREAGSNVDRSSRDRFATLAASLAAAVMLGAWSFSEVTSPWLYRGGFALHAVLSALVINAILRPGSPFHRGLSIRPLPWIGRLSYGAYVYHWPIFLILSPERTGLDPAPLLAARALATLCCAWGSHRWIEQPIRARQWLGARTAIVTASILLPLAFVAATVFEQPRYSSRSENAGATEASRILGRTPRISNFGDSTALVLVGTLFPWLEQAGIERQPGGVRLGCGLIDRGQRYLWSRWHRRGKECRNLLAKWRQTVTESPVDVVVILVGPWEVLTWRLDRNAPTRAFGDPVFDRDYAGIIDDTVAMFSAQGIGTIWLTPPPVTMPTERWKDHSKWLAANDPKRMERLSELLMEAGERWPDNLRVIDFAGRLREQGLDLDAEEVRPDGVHFRRQVMAEIVDDWLGSEVLRATNELVRAAAQ